MHDSANLTPFAPRQHVCRPAINTAARRALSKLAISAEREPATARHLSEHDVRAGRDDIPPPLSPAVLMDLTGDG